MKNVSIEGRGPNRPTPPQGIRRVITRVAQTGGLKPDDVLNWSRKRQVVAVRHAAWIVCAQEFKHLKTQRLAYYLWRDHTSLEFALGRLKRRKPGPQLQAETTKVLRAYWQRQITGA